MAQIWGLVKACCKRFFSIGLAVNFFNGKNFLQFIASKFKQEMKYFPCVLCCEGTDCEQFYVGVSWNLRAHVFLCFTLHSFCLLFWRCWNIVLKITFKQLQIFILDAIITFITRTKSRKGVCHFNEQWLKDDRFKAWLIKG